MASLPDHTWKMNVKKRATETSQRIRLCSGSLQKRPPGENFGSTPAPKHSHPSAVPPQVSQGAILQRAQCRCNGVALAPFHERQRGGPDWHLVSVLRHLGRGYSRATAGSCQCTSWTWFCWHKGSSGRGEGGAPGGGWADQWACWPGEGIGVGMWPLGLVASRTASSDLCLQCCGRQPEEAIGEGGASSGVGARMCLCPREAPGAS